MDYVLRLQALDGYAALFDDVFSDRFSRILYVHHTGKKGDNPHYHFCFTCDYKKDALRKYLKSQFTLASGNKHLSLKDWDGSIRACSYLYHEGTSVTNLRGFSVEQLDEFKTLNEEVKSSHIKIPVIVEEVVALIRPSFGGYRRDSFQDERKMVFEVLVSHLMSKSEWIPNRFQMERYITRIRAILNDSPVNKKIFISSLYSEMFG